MSSKETYSVKQQITVAGKGFETSAFSSGNSEVSEEGGAKSGALGDQNASIEADLQEIIDRRRPDLLKAVKPGILVMVRSQVE